jgi:tRNA A-37 threonylcarbamoyl transferase component Bud32
MDDLTVTRGPEPAPQARATFLPGTVVGGRYRIVALVGQGGMGEVYRADDLKIGQAVALKFLPADLERHPDLLQRLFGEVRIARQVSHPNVCRVYDVGDSEGHHFITMEYVDGEDLSALLRRIGRLPQEKAIDLARQIAAGLAAAHVQGIVHRDLKPANVLVDGRGRARITDFGLAVVAETVRGKEARSGTPGYMAPEQAEGSTITPRTDVYALGLLTYEMITGRRPSPGMRPSSLDPTIEALILRCLESDPEKRPASAMEFLLALPGGDPLEAALRAGETPSPEMVAAAGEENALAPGRAWTLLGFCLLVAAAAIFAGVYGVGLDRVPMPKSPEVLSERAREVAQALGDDVPPHSHAWWMGVAGGYASWSRTHPHTLPPSGARPSVVHFVYRESPQPILPRGRLSPTRDDPPMSHTGDALVAFDLDGNLVDFARVAPQLGPADTVRAAPTDWGTLLSLTGIPAADLRAVPPLWTPDVPSDARAAWIATGGRAPVRLEAAGWKGRPVWLRSVEPWERPERDTRDPTASPIGGAFFVGIVVVSLLGMGVLARHNLRVGRGDMRGAVRVAVAVLVGFGLSDALTVRWAPDPVHIWTILMRLPYFPALFICVTYLGVEPYLRRRWPRRLIAWTRLLEGKWLDPLVGREALLGILAGAAAALLNWAPAALEGHPDSDALLGLFPIGRASDFWAQIVGVSPDGVMKGLGSFGILLLIRLLVRRDFPAWIGLGVLLIASSISSWNRTPIEWIAVALVCASFVIATRVGVVAAVMSYAIFNLLVNCTPLTFDFSRWYAWRTGVVAILAVASAAWAFRAAMGQRKILSAAMLEG